MGGIKLKVIEKIYDITPGNQKILTDTSNIPMKKLNDQDIEIFINILESLDFENYVAIRCEPKSSRYKHSKINFKKRNLEGQGLKIIIPSNIIDIYIRLAIFLRLKLSGDTDTLTEASNFFDELYKRGEIQNEQQFRKAVNKFQI